MARRRACNAFNDRHAADVAWKAYELWMAGETAQDVSRAMGIPVYSVYKAAALVARNPEPFRLRWEKSHKT